MPNLTRGKITKDNKKHGGKFAPNYRAFNILQTKIEDFLDKSTKLWKSIYKLNIDKDEEENKVEANAKEKIGKQKENKVEEKQIEEKKEEVKGEEEKKAEEDKEKGEEETQKREDMAIAK